MTMKTVGVVGAGGIVAKLHLPTLLARDDVSVVWVADIDPRRLDDLAAGYGVPTIQTEGDLSSLPVADAVLLALPYGVRAPYYEQLSARGEALYVEKPLARTMEQHTSLLELFAGSDLGVGYQQRGSAAAVAARAFVAGGLLGTLQSVEVRHGFPGQLTGSPYSSQFNLAGGGLLFEVGVHWLDLALHVMGGVRTVGAEGRMVVDDGFDLDTEARLTVETVSGPVDVSVLVSGLRVAGNFVRFNGANSSLTLEPSGRLWLGSPHAKQTESFEVRVPPGPSEPFQLCNAAWSDFLGGGGGGRPSWTSAQASVCTTQAIELLYGLAS